MMAISPYNSNQTVCFTGHRPERLPQDAGELAQLRDRLTEEIETAIARGRTDFISGAMSGFDTLAAEQVLQLKKKYPHIQCIIVAPFSLHYFPRKNWTAEWEARLRAVLKQADIKISLSEHAYRGVYFARDRTIVDMAAEVIAYYGGGPGGTQYTIAYARSQHKPVINIWKEHN